MGGGGRRSALRHEARKSRSAGVRGSLGPTDQRNLDPQSEVRAKATRARMSTTPIAVRNHALRRIIFVPVF